MAPSRIRTAHPVRLAIPPAADAVLRFSMGTSSLGAVLVAESEKGVAAILIGDDPEVLVHDLERQFPKSELIGSDKAVERRVRLVIGLIENPAHDLDVPLDIRGTAFQQKVWAALRKIPPGTTASYSEIARTIGRPQSVRAVAGACAANAIAVAIPCHRVVRSNGDLSGYRWGIERKEALLARETAATPKPGGKQQPQMSRTETRPRPSRLAGI